MAASRTLNFSVKIIFIIIHDDGTIEAPIEKYAEFFKSIAHKKAFNNVLYIDILGDRIQRRRHNSQSGAIKFLQISSDDKTFPKLKTSDEGFNSMIQVVQYDDLPSSRVVDGKIVGVSGKLVDIFCAKYNLTYRVINLQGKRITTADFDRYMMEADISLYTLTTITDDSKFNVNISLNINDGVCFLAPINIPVFSNKHLPFDSLAVGLFAISILSITLAWFLISKRSSSNFSFFFIVISIYKLCLGQGYVREHVMNRKEKILLYSFMFGNIFLINLYQSWLISIMLSEPVMRSIQSIQELNDSNTKLSRFAISEEIQFRDGVVKKIIDLSREAITFDVPENFDHDLAYSSRCQYARFFYDSRRNIKGKGKIFDIIPQKFLLFPLTYKASRSFVLAEEFRFFSNAVIESGIRDQWSREITNKKPSEVNQKTSNKISPFLERMNFPFVILATGHSGALTAFLIEVTIHLLKRFTKSRVEKKVNLRISHHHQGRRRMGWDQIELETLHAIN